MSASASGFDFSQFVPGFDFLQRMAQPASAPSSPTATMPAWIAPTMDIKEVERRIQELKTVLFWLEQNSTALKATIQALEVQKLTLSTLQHMHTNMGNMAQAMQAAAAGWSAQATSVTAPEQMAATTGTTAESAPAPVSAGDAAPVHAAAQSTASAQQTASEAETAAGAIPDTTPGAMEQAMAQASQWWGSMFQTFQYIAQQAQNDMQQRAASAAATGCADVAEPVQADIANQAQVAPSAPAQQAGEQPAATTARQPASVSATSASATSVLKTPHKKRPAAG